MKLEPITNRIAQPFTFSCAACGTQHLTTYDPGARADLDGEPFTAYYCGECAADAAAAMNRTEADDVADARRCYHGDDVAEDR